MDPTPAKRDPFHIRYRRPLLLLALAVLLDLAIRVASGFDMARIVPWEAGLFAACAASYGWSFTRDGLDPAVRRADAWLAGLFGLAAVRSILWASGLDVATANLVVFALAIIAAGLLLWRRRRLRP